MKPHKISTHSAYSDNCYFHFFYWLSDWVQILWGEFQLSILKNKKVLFLKKIFFRPYHQDTSKRWRVLSQFSRRFCFYCPKQINIAEITMPMTMTEKTKYNANYNYIIKTSKSFQPHFVAPRKITQIKKKLPIKVSSCDK